MERIKRITIITFICLVAVSCGNGTGRQTETTDKAPVTADTDNVEVLYFHGKRRCATCLSIENEAREVADSIRANGEKVIFRAVDMSEEDNACIVAEYEVAWSTLLVVGNKAGKRDVENMTEYAFANARRSPEKFKQRLASEIEKRL